MSRAAACEIIKLLATRSKATAAELVAVLGWDESSVREWLYEMQSQGVVRLAGTADRAPVPGKSARGRRKVQLWEWALPGTAQKASSSPPLDVCTDPDNCKRCKAPDWDKCRHEHAGLQLGDRRA